MDEQRDSVVRALREGRISADTALAWLEREQRDVRATRGGNVTAHSNEHARQMAQDAINTAFSGNDNPEERDEFSSLFPPHAPLGAPVDDTQEGHYAPPKTSLIYPGEGQGKKTRTPVTWDGYVTGSADADEDDELYDAVYGPNPPVREPDRPLFDFTAERERQKRLSGMGDARASGPSDFDAQDDFDAHYRHVFPPADAGEARARRGDTDD